MKKRRKDTRWLVGVAMMAAIIVLLANTPLGLINIYPIKASICFSPFLSTSLLGAAKALWVSVGCLILIGVVAGWLWILLKRLRSNDLVALPVVGFVGSMTNTVTVMGSIYFLLRPEYAAANNKAVSAVFDIIMATITGAGVMEALVALVLVAAIGKALVRLYRPSSPA